MEKLPGLLLAMCCPVATAGISAELHPLFQDITMRGDQRRHGVFWVASGRSNMERQFGLRAGQKPIVNWEQEAAAANHPAIRQFYVWQTKPFTPQTAVQVSWSVCAPETVANFTAAS